MIGVEVVEESIMVLVFEGIVKGRYFVVISFYVVLNFVGIFMSLYLLVRKRMIYIFLLVIIYVDEDDGWVNGYEIIEFVKYIIFFVFVWVIYVYLRNIFDC